MTNEELKNVIADWRGGIPPHCDFCGELTKRADLHPEEGGEWACIKCIERWEREKP